MPEVRLKRRIANNIAKRFAELRLDQVPDPRDDRGKRWKLGRLLEAVVLGHVAGATSLEEVESLTASLSTELRGWLKQPSRISDTTLRDALCKLTPELLRAPLQRLVRAAARRKALEPVDLPFGVVSLDGKAFSIAGCDDWYAQRQTQSDDSRLVGVVRSITASLTSCAARPVIDVVPLPARTNEMGGYEVALRALLAASPNDLFRLVTYDAGACSAYNATVTRQLGLHYLFTLNVAQPTLLTEVRRVLAGREPNQADAVASERVGNVRVLRRVYLAQASDIAAPPGWEHLKTLVRVQTEQLDGCGHSVTEERYFMSSLPCSRLSPRQWGLVVRRHWGVELAHQTLDVALREDAKPWIVAAPRAAAVVAVLRRMAYTLLALFRAVTQRSEQRRQVPWAQLLREVYLTLVATERGTLAGMRRHGVGFPPPA